MRFFRKAMLLGLGVLTITKDAAEKLINELVEKGEMSQDEAREFVDDVVRKGEEQKQELKNFIRRELEKYKNELGMASQDQVDELRARIIELEKRLAE